MRLSTSKVRGLSGQILTHSRSQSRGQLEKVDAKAAWRVRQIGGSSSTFTGGILVFTVRYVRLIMSVAVVASRLQDNGSKKSDQG